MWADPSIFKKTKKHIKILPDATSVGGTVEYIFTTARPFRPHFVLISSLIHSRFVLNSFTFHPQFALNSSSFRPPFIHNSSSFRPPFVHNWPSFILVSSAHSRFFGKQTLFSSGSQLLTIGYITPLVRLYFCSMVLPRCVFVELSN
jgi:hypothetical protein